MPIPFVIPVTLRAGAALGQVVRYGTVLKDTNTGRIVGHLQETGVFREALSHVGLGLLNPFGALNLAADTWNTVQLARVIQMVQTLGTGLAATAGIGVLGVGVSLAGAVVVLRRLGDVRDGIRGLTRDMREKFAEVALRECEDLFARVIAADAAAHALTDSGNVSPSEWRALSRDFDEFARTTLTRVTHQLEAPELELGLLEKLVFAHLMCRGAAIEGLVRANAISTALELGRSSTVEYRRSFDVLNPARLTRMQLKGASNRPTPAQIIDASRRTLRFMADLQTQTLQAEQRELLLATMAARRIDGSEYLERLEGERQEPFLALPALVN